LNLEFKTTEWMLVTKQDTHKEDTEALREWAKTQMMQKKTNSLWKVF